MLFYLIQQPFSYSNFLQSQQFLLISCLIPLLHDVKAELMTSSSLCDLHWPQVSDYPSCRFRAFFPTWQISSSLLQVAGRASISLGLRSINLDDVMLLARARMTSSYQKSSWINSRTELIRSYSTVPASNWEKETATPGFEPSTFELSLEFDWRSRPLSHHGRFQIELFYLSYCSILSGRFVMRRIKWSIIRKNKNSLQFLEKMSYHGIQLS